MQSIYKTKNINSCANPIQKIVLTQFHTMKAVQYPRVARKPTTQL